MEINVIKIAGCEVFAFAQSGNFYFLNKFHGVVGIAKRVNGMDETDWEIELTAGSINTVGGSMSRPTIIAGMKRFISSLANRYIPTNVNYIDSGAICNHGLYVEAFEY